MYQIINPSENALNFYQFLLTYSRLENFYLDTCMVLVVPLKGQREIDQHNSPKLFLWMSVT